MPTRRFFALDHFGQLSVRQGHGAAPPPQLLTRGHRDGTDGQLPHERIRAAPTRSDSEILGGR